MAGKLPVERTITEAYRIGFTRFLSVLGRVWLPYLLFVALVIGLVFLFAPDLPRMIAERNVDISALIGLSRIAIVIFVFGFVVSAMISVGLQRLALGLHPRPVYVFFSLGPQVWRMAAALFLAGLIVFVIALIAAAVAAALWFAADGLGGAAWLVRTIVVIAAVAFLVYVMLRLLFFLPAIVVAEQTIGIERAWILGGHNFWRILIVTIAVVVPIAVAFHVLSWATFGPAMAWPAGQLGSRALFRALLLQFGTLGLVGLLFQLVERIVIVAVFNAAVGKAYLAVTASDAAAPATGVP